VIRGRYAVGCDGSRSVVREGAGITQTRSDHDRTMVLLVFRSRELHRLLERYPGKSFYNVLHPRFEGYWQFFGRVDLGQTFFFHAPVPHGTTAENGAFDQLLHDAVGASFDIDLLHVGFWDLRFATADNYRAGRVFVAGDAAHSHPPYGGYGINTGFEDAVNLGWKLAALEQGWGGPALLDSYDAERRPVFASTARDFISKAIEEDRAFLARYDPARNRDAFELAWSDRQPGAAAEVDAFEPNYEGSPICGAEGGRAPSALGGHQHRARAGHHLTPQRLNDGRNVFEALGPGFTLLAFDASAAIVAGFEREAAALGAPLAVVRDHHAGEVARYEASLILVRPDQFIAWAGEAEAADPAGTLRASIGL
jgi:hypothetical protein